MTKVEYIANCYARDKQNALCRDFMTLKSAVMHGARKQKELALAAYCKSECDTDHLACPHKAQGGCAKYKNFKSMI